MSTLLPEPDYSEWVALELDEDEPDPYECPCCVYTEGDWMIGDYEDWILGSLVRSGRLGRRQYRYWLTA